jgi:hypothetical protein
MPLPDRESAYAEMGKRESIRGLGLPFEYQKISRKSNRAIADAR